jgi:hypothetical protein
VLFGSAQDVFGEHSRGGYAEGGRAMGMGAADAIAQRDVRDRPRRGRIMLGTHVTIRGRR